MKKSLGIYVHIPFCVLKCRYCDFCSFAGKGSQDMRAYVDELCRRIERFDGARDYEVDTLYFGGGTPSLIGAESIGRILDSVRGTFCLSESAEITLECNPATVDEAFFRSVRSLGVNRLSIGLQSASDSELLLLGRIHTVADFVKTYNDARAAGFDNVSADLMYGIPDQTMESLEHSVRFLASLAPEHISAYGLTVEDGTYFAAHRSELSLADADGQYEMYMLLSRLLSEYGYGKYEISNFAREGRESRHNMRYWRCSEYIGFGVSAHSYFCGERFGNSRDIGAFLAGEDIVEERVAIGEDERRAEHVMLGLRLASGIDVDEYSALFGKEFPTSSLEMKRFIDGGLMRFDGKHLSFTDKGFFVSNAIISDILDLI